MEAKIDGLAELHKQLQALPLNIERKLMRGALRAAQKVVLEQARQNINNLSGELGASLRISTRVRRDGQISARVVAGNKKAFYAHMVEFGTGRHFIKPKNRKSLFFAGMAREVVDHPGATAKPFMRPAADAAMGNNSEAMEAFKAYLRSRITKEMDKLPDESDSTTR